MASGVPSAVLLPGSRYFYAHTDHLAPLKLSDRSGSVWAARYAAFGGQRATNSTVIYNLRLPGQYFDQETACTTTIRGLRQPEADIPRKIQSDLPQL
jgi:hypothetical protein